MARIRTVKPDFFEHEVLYHAEQKSKLPLRVAFVGLWTQADREGRFRWQPRRLKLHCLPYDDLDFGDVLDALAEYEFIIRYQVDGEDYGAIPTWKDHQVINIRESQSKIPPPVGSNVVHMRARACTGQKPERTEPTLPIEAPAIANDPFDRFMAAYPKRKGDNPRKPARLKFEAALARGVDPEAIMAGVRMFADEMAADNKVGTVYVPHAATWLSQERWKRDDKPASNVVQMKRFWADVDSPQWREWDAHLKKHGRNAPQTDGRPDGPDGRIRRGWYFESEFPPGHQVA